MPFRIGTGAYDMPGMHMGHQRAVVGNPGRGGLPCRQRIRTGSSTRLSSEDILHRAGIDRIEFVNPAGCIRLASRTDSVATLPIIRTVL
ncbi:hypothetical protein Aru02nite_72010 [Actinocatenispora rupis]|uniref:Uncharacterized protein n=1 Tax=Actinocatenispora rupis TaxID=519421 RepID=A0A8J3NGD6_9ACTN|nr:hypothetical protein Aru02nite_72010 [Actinocatenispora rupis]